MDKRKSANMVKILIFLELFLFMKKNAINIGDGCSICSKAFVNSTSGFNHTHLRVEGDGQIVIGNNVGISHANVTAFSNIIIEDNVLISSGVKI